MRTSSKCNILLIYNFILFVLFIFEWCAKSVVRDPSQITVGKARFTVIAPECIRLEYSENGNFEDSPTLFAVNRSSRYSEAKIVQSGNSVTISTGKIRLSYLADKNPFNKGNLSA